MFATFCLKLTSPLVISIFTFSVLPRLNGISPVVTSQGRVAGAPRRLRTAGAGHSELGPADRLLARGLRGIGDSL